MNWLYWWLSEFILSAFLWLGLAPLLGSLAIKKAKADLGQHRGAFEFILGAALLVLLSSLLVPLHRGALAVEVLIFMYLKLFKKQKTDFKISILDLAVVLPVIIALAAHPVAIDSNLSELQFSFMKDIWPLDWRHRLDMHMALSLVVGSWFKDVPLINSLTVQGCFYSLLVWRILLSSFELLKKSKILYRDQILLAAVFLGSLYYRKQIHVKASPIGAAFIILALAGLSNKKIKFNAVLWGLLFASAFNLGEYGGLLLIFLAPFILFCGENNAKNFITAWPWIILFSAPEICRKIYIFSKGSFLALIAVSIMLLGFFFITKKIRITIKEFSILPVLAVLMGVAVFTNFMLAPQNSGASDVSFWQWSVGANGLLLFFSAGYFWKNKNEDSAKLFMALFCTQLLFFTVWPLVEPLKLQKFNPDLLWWNLSKNATMITLPLMTTLLGTLFFTEKLQKFSPKVYWGVLAFFIFLQDPLVKRVGDGPFAPHAPRLSVMQSLSEMYWENYKYPQYVSKSGKIVLHKTALPVPDLVEELFLKQKQTDKRLSVCFPKMVTKEMPSFGVDAYTFNSAISVKGYYNCVAENDFEVVPDNLACEAGKLQIKADNKALLCSNPRP